MPEGFEKQVNAEELTDLLEFLTQRGKYLPIPLDKVATVVSTKGMFYDENAPEQRLVFPDWKPKTFEGVPFILVDPQGDKVANVILLYGPNGDVSPEDAEVRDGPCELAGEGDSPARRRQRLGLSLRGEGLGVADRAAALRRRQDGGPRR